MSRKLRPDTFNKQTAHHFRNETKLSPEQVTIRTANSAITRDCTAGFEQIDVQLRGMAIHGPSPADSHVMVQSIWGNTESTTAEAKKAAQALVTLWRETLSNGRSCRQWPTLRELAQIYAGIAALTGHPVEMSLPRSQGRKVQITYPHVDMTSGHYATTRVLQSDYSDLSVLTNKAKEDAAIDRRLRRHVLDRTTIDRPTLLLLQSMPDPTQALEQLLKHREVKIGQFAIRNDRENLSIHQTTWEADGQWLEYFEGTISARNLTVPATMLAVMPGMPLGKIISGINHLDKAIIARASNPKNYVMSERPRQPKERIDAPTLRLKLSTNRMTLRAAGISWTGSSPEHQAIQEADAYNSKLQGPFATTNVEANLTELLTMAEGLGLIEKSESS